MKFEWGYLFGMVLQTVPEPRKVARDIFALRYPRTVLWQALALLLVAMAFLSVIGGILFPLDPAIYGPLLADPMMSNLAEASSSVISVFIIYWLGHALGGTGTFEQAILTMIWLQFVLFVIEIGVLFLGVFAPGMAVLLWLAGIIMTFWILSHFIAEMHGFRSAGVVFLGILLTLLVLVVFLSVLFALLGLGTDLPAEAST